jgi:3D (Asp-Asp-Asp) domain-containing protein
VLWALRAVVGCAGLVSSGVLAFGLARDVVVTAAGSDAPQVELVPSQPGPPGTVPAMQPAEEETPLPAAAPCAKPHHHCPQTLHRTYRVTAYADWGVTASGKMVGVGQCAAPVNIPFGSKIYIPALRREFVVTDRTHPRFRHNTVDLFMPGDQNCREFGRRYLKCEIRLPPKSRTAARD